MIELDDLVVNIRRACDYDSDLSEKVLAEIRQSLWLAELDERLQKAEAGVENVLNLHRRQERPTRHWEPCAEHVPSPENRRAAGGWIALQNEMHACSQCTYTEHYHCEYDAHDSCGHDDFPCATARAAQNMEGEKVDDEQDR